MSEDQVAAAFEDIRIGDTTDLGAHTFTAEEIVRFAERFDPQPFHLDAAAAAAGPFGALSASGWHTGSVFMKLLVGTLQRREAELAASGQRMARRGPSPGFKDLRWVKPVLAGDTIRYQMVVTAKTESRTRPEWGIVNSDTTGRNQHGEVVFSFKSTVFVERRGS